MQPEICFEGDTGGVHDAAAAASKAAVVDRQQLRAAVSSLSLCIDRGDDETSPSSSPGAESAASRLSAATAHVIQSLALEDGSACAPSRITTLHVALFVQFHSNLSGSGQSRQQMSSLPAACSLLLSNQKAVDGSSQRSGFLPASSQWSAVTLIATCRHTTIMTRYCRSAITRPLFRPRHLSSWQLPVRILTAGRK